MNPASDTRLTIANFEAGNVDATEFDHEAHVYMAWLFLQDYPLPQAIERFDSALKDLTRELGVPGKYHATITWLFLVLINQRRISGETWTKFRSRNADLVDDSRSTLGRYYSEDLLSSDAARQHFVLPDRLAG